MQDSPQRQTTKSRLNKGGRPCGSLSSNRLQYVSLEQMNSHYGKLVIVSDTVERPKGLMGRAFVRTQCVLCGTEFLHDFTNVLAGLAGCRKCGRKQFRQRTHPQWLYNRCFAARARCSNPEDSAYSRYGGRGIKFLFKNPMDMAEWIQRNLGLHQHLQLDRRDNNGHYAAGNLRYSTASQQQSHTRQRSNNFKANLFRLKYPEIRYADSTLRDLFYRGFTDTQIIERFYRPSCKPKGKYGTFSTADPDIVSLAKDCSFTTA